MAAEYALLRGSVSQERWLRRLQLAGIFEDRLQHRIGDEQLLRHQTPSTTACGRLDSIMMAMPQTTRTMPASRSGPNRSPNTMLEAAAPTSGTSSASGTTCAAV